MFTATIYHDSPALIACLNLLAKHKLIYVSSETTHDDKPAIKINVTGKALKEQRKPRLKKPANTTYGSERLKDGGYLWKTPSGTFKASFAYDAKAQDRIKRETQKRIDSNLTAMTGYNKSAPYSANGDYRTHLKGDLWNSL